MPRSILSLGMFSARAAKTAARRRGLPFTSPPPMRAATVISLISLVKILPRLASLAPFLCLMLAHLLCPDMGFLLIPSFSDDVYFLARLAAALRFEDLELREAGLDRLGEGLEVLPLEDLADEVPARPQHPQRDGERRLAQREGARRIDPAAAGRR